MSMKIFLKFYRDEFVFYTLILSLFLWGFFSSLFLSFSDQEIIILERNEKGFLKALTEEERGTTEKVFLSYFITLCFSYDRASFKDHISEAGNFMSDKLWKEKRAYFLKVFEEVKKDKISQFVEIVKITKTSPHTYEVKVKVLVFKNQKSEEREGKILLQIKKTKITDTNFYGWEVEDVKVL